MIERDRVAGIAALLTAVAGLGYGIAFVVLHAAAASAALLLAGGLTTVVALGGVWHGQGGERGAMAGLALGLAGAFGAIVHGAADLAVALHPVALDPAAPNPVDPRGVLTFGAAGLGLLVLSRVAARTGRLPRGVRLLAAVTGTLLVVLYLARLVVLDPASPLVLVPALLAGFAAAPLLWVAIGSVLVRAPSRAGAT